MAGKLNRPLLDRFMEKVEKLDNGCWRWTARIAPSGYGMIGVGSRLEYAHRVSHRLFIGEIGPKLFVCHSCDNRWCVSPEHLWTGSAADNMADCKEKGRARGPNYRGEQVGTSKLGEGDIPAIRARLAAGESKVGIAKSYNVSKTAIQHIEIGKTWRHVTC